MPMLGLYSWPGKSVWSSTPKLRLPVSSNWLRETSTMSSAVSRNSCASSPRSVTLTPIGSPLRIPNSAMVRFEVVRTDCWPVIASMISSASARGSPPCPTPMWTTTFSRYGSRISWAALSASLIRITRRLGVVAGEVLVDDDEVLLDRLVPVVVVADEHGVRSRAERHVDVVDLADAAGVLAGDGGDERALFVLEVSDDVLGLVVDDDRVFGVVRRVRVDEHVRAVVERQLNGAAGDDRLVRDLPEPAARGLLVDGGQRKPTALVGEDAEELPALGERQDVEHPDRTLLVRDRVPVDEDRVVVQRVARLLRRVDVTEHVPQQDDERNARLTVRAGAGLDGERVGLALDRPGVRYCQSLLMSRHSLSSWSRASRRSSSRSRSVTRTLLAGIGRGTSSPSAFSTVTSSTVIRSADRSTASTSASVPAASPRSTSTVSPALTRTFRCPYSSRRSSVRVARTWFCRSWSGAVSDRFRCLRGCFVMIRRSSSRSRRCCRIVRRPRERRGP